jgi:hypothetical protein
VLPDIPYDGAGGRASGAGDRILAGAVPSPKDASDR